MYNFLDFETMYTVCMEGSYLKAANVFKNSSLQHCMFHNMQEYLSHLKIHKNMVIGYNWHVYVWENGLFCCLQLILTQLSGTAGFGATFNDTQPLADVEAALNDVFAIQLYSSDTQLLESSSDPSEPAQVPILAINALPNSAADGMTV